MIEFNPPFETRDTEELIIISKSNTDDSQQLAIDLAKTELKKRGLTQSEIDKKYEELEDNYQQEIKKELDKNAIEDFTVFEKIFILLFWYKALFSNWNLRKDGFILKSKRRIHLIGIGILIYLIFILYAIY